MTDLVKFSKTESELLAEIRAWKDQPIEVSIPEDTDPKTVVRWSKIGSSLIDKNDSERAILLQILGRLHFLARTNPAILEAAKCENLKEYEETVLVCRNHRATVYKFSSAYKALPELTPADAAEIGSTNLEIAAKVTPKDASASQRKKIIAKAKELSTEQFREWAEGESGVSSKGATSTDSFTLIGSGEEIREFKEFLAMPGFREHAGTDRPIAMVLAAIKESSTEWGDGPEPEPPAVSDREDDW